MKHLPSNTFSDVWQKADRNWKYSKSYYQVNMITSRYLETNAANFSGTIFA